MKRSILICAIIILGAGLAGASGVSLYTSLGSSTPARNSDDFQEYWKPGLNLGAGVGVRMSRLTELVFDLNYCKHELDDEEFLEDNNLDGFDLTSTGGDVSIAAFLMNARILFTGSDAKVKGYFIGGLGVGFVSVDDYSIGDGDLTITSPGHSDSNVALRLGLGLDFRLGSKSWLYLESNGFGVAGEDEGVLVNLFKLGFKFRPGD